MILFVASNPSKLNTNPTIAMVGSKSEKNFNGWVEYLSPQKDYFVINVSDKVLENDKTLKKREYDLPRLASYVINPSFDKIVALGNVAEDALKQLGIENYYKLPHPSPRNRFLNNTVQVEAVLEDCKQWLEK